MLHYAPSCCYCSAPTQLFPSRMQSSRKILHKVPLSKFLHACHDRDAFTFLGDYEDDGDTAAQSTHNKTMDDGDNYSRTRRRRRNESSHVCTLRGGDSSRYGGKHCVQIMDFFFIFTVSFSTRFRGCFSLMVLCWVFFSHLRGGFSSVKF